MNVVGTNTGHGHAWPRPDGMVARCGGPAMCRPCAGDQAKWGVERERSAIAAEILETIQTQVYSLIADLPNNVVDEVGEKVLLAKPLYRAALEGER